MQIDIITLFPEFFNSPLDISIIKRAKEKGIVTISIHNLRDYSKDKHKTADDRPYGGGPGMVLKPELIFEAVENLPRLSDTKIILTSPSGELFCQNKASELSKSTHLIIICGHYEGVDERVSQYLITDEISIGNYVLSGGEIPALVIIDGVIRLVPGVLGNEESIICESFMNGLLDYPQYTRPYDFRGWRVPDVLISGNHKEIEKWRKEQMIKNTIIKSKVIEGLEIDLIKLQKSINVCGVEIADE